ncbi:MAG: TIGR04255 family protein [Nitrospira sp.]|nr:TIGR04255 family protein [Nitrospira sp.]
MNAHPTLNNAPIAEALIDIRVKLPATLKVEIIDTIYDAIKDKYPDKQEQKISELKLDLRSEDTVNSSGAIVNGYRYISSDKKQIVQTRLDGFTLSRLHPYVKWDEMRDEAFRLWELYKDITSPDSIIRVAVRYINILNIQLPIKDFGDYLSAPPIVPDGLPQGISSFLNRIVISEPSIGASAIITQALEQIALDAAPIILDIDAFKLKPNGMEEKDAWEAIDQLRHFKNRIFFNSITDRLKEEYK